jgi:transcriptional regulator with XRE-family HTH domain
LRELARKTHMSPTCLSKIETGKFPPPAEDKLLAIAQELNVDPDVLVAQAGRVPQDVLKTIRQQPVPMVRLIRASGELMEQPNA